MEAPNNRGNPEPRRAMGPLGRRGPLSSEPMDDFWDTFDRWRRGDEDARRRACDYLFHAEYRQVFALVRPAAGTKEECEDAVMAGFCSAWEYLDRRVRSEAFEYRGEGALRRYFRELWRGRSIDPLRKKRPITVPLYEETEHGGEADDEEPISPEPESFLLDRPGIDLWIKVLAELTQTLVRSPVQRKIAGATLLYVRDAVARSEGEIRFDGREWREYVAWHVYGVELDRMDEKTRNRMDWAIKRFKKTLLDAIAAELGYRPAWFDRVGGQDDTDEKGGTQ